MDIALFLLIIGVFIILIVMNRREKKIVMLSIVGCFVVTILGIVLLSGREESIQIVKDSDKTTETNYSYTSLTELIIKDSDISATGIGPSIRIVPLSENTNNQEYIAMVKATGTWDDSVWHLQFDGEKIIDKNKIEDISGNILSCNAVELSQGTFIEFYEATHMGNGEVVLWNPSTGNVEHRFERTIDCHYEEYVDEEVVKEYNLPKILDEKGYGYSFVQQGDKLTSYYKDIDEDGDDDAVFYGICNLMSSEEKSPLHMFPVERIYTYDKPNKTFVYDINKSNDPWDERIVLLDDFASVYDVTQYSEDGEFTPKYQYYVYNQDKSQIIDSGITEMREYLFEKVSDHIVRAKMGAGTGVWYCIYYNQKTGQKSKAFDSALDEFDEYVIYQEYKDECTYLIVENMFDENEKIREYMIGEDWYLPGMLEVKYDNGKIKVEYTGSGKEFKKEIDI